MVTPKAKSCWKYCKRIRKLGEQVGHYGDQNQVSCCQRGVSKDIFEGHPPLQKELESEVLNLKDDLVEVLALILSV